MLDVWKLFITQIKESLHSFGLNRHTKVINIARVDAKERILLLRRVRGCELFD